MGDNTEYDGYQPFQYLDAGSDYTSFEFQEELTGEWGELYEVPLNDDEEETRSERLSTENTIVSLHEHAFLFPKDIDEQTEYARQGRMWTAYEFLSRSNLDAIFD